MQLFTEFFTEDLESSIKTADCDEFHQFWYHAIQLVVECDRIYSDEMARLSKRNQEINDQIYSLKAGILVKNELTDLANNASYISALVQSNIFIPIGSLLKFKN